MKPILVTGAAGFIGYHLSERLLSEGQTVVGLDNLNDYYDVRLKEARLQRLQARDGFRFVRMDLADRQGMADLFAQNEFGRVVNLAAQAGVRYSLENPHAYIESNVTGFTNILEGCRHSGVQHLVYASSSSVYGSNRVLPFAVRNSVDHPISLYAATKKANELMAHTYSHLYGLPTTGLRFFTVYGPWGRPDMALFLFTKAILEGRPIRVFNHGNMRRDFTYVDDIVEGIRRVMDAVPAADPEAPPADDDPSRSHAPFRVYNIGHNEPVQLLDFIAAIEDALGMKAERELLPMQPGDVEATFADIEALTAAVGYRPKTSVNEGIPAFIAWYREFYGV